jgi:hypothetical protein
MKFYKYMAAETGKKVLEKSSLRWASPTLFNDPFDVQFDLRVEYDRERVIDQALQNIVDKPPRICRNSKFAASR